MKHLHNACSKACLTLTALPLVLLMPAAHGQHKTGVNIDFELNHLMEENDSTVQGDRTKTFFKLAKARWNLSGKTGDLGYKFEFDFAKGPVTLRSVRADYHLTGSTMISFGKGYKPIPFSGPAKFYKGDIGVQLSTKYDGGSFKIGVANRKQSKWSNGIGGLTTLPRWGYGLEWKGKAGAFEPRIRIAGGTTPSEKVLATGYKYHGRNSQGVSFGGLYKAYSTKIEVDYAIINRSAVNESLNGGPQSVIKPKSRLNGYKIKVTQGLTSKWSAIVEHKGLTEHTDGKKTLEATESSIEANVKPDPKTPIKYFAEFEYEVKKRPGKKSVTEKKLSVGAKANPSVVIAKK